MKYRIWQDTTGAGGWRIHDPRRPQPLYADTWAEAWARVQARLNIRQTRNGT